jgi:2-polyprenyl-3-methyl-5-hydroxy-6-metoxy-1,4-benzoquinol methylase
MFGATFRKIKRRILKWLKIDELDASSDTQFLESIYQKLLGRGVDETGKAHYLSYLRQTHSRLAVILSVVQSEEFINKVVRENIPILSLIEERPDRYRLIKDIHGQEVWIFQIERSEDFDWLERKIIENGYYEKPGVWSFLVTEDKRLHAEIAALFEPRTVLDVGCANGPVMKCLKDMGISSKGVDISRMALAKAFPEIRGNIHLGDILSIDFQERFDFILGLDIFEHLNPNKLGLYLAKIESLLESGGFLFCNIPAIGRDDVFGEIFEVYLREWEKDLEAGRLFSTIHVDSSGYPYNGHIIGAGSGWWAKQFEHRGFHREIELEKAIHGRYDEAMTKIHVARKSFFIFSKAGEASKIPRILERLK